VNVRIARDDQTSPASIIVTQFARTHMACSFIIQTQNSDAEVMNQRRLRSSAMELSAGDIVIVRIHVRNRAIQIHQDGSGRRWSKRSRGLRL